MQSNVELHLSRREEFTKYLDGLEALSKPEAAFEAAVWGLNSFTTLRGLLCRPELPAEEIALCIDSIHDACFRLSRLLRCQSIKSAFSAVNVNAIEVGEIWSASHLECVEGYLSRILFEICFAAGDYHGSAEFERAPCRAKIIEHLDLVRSFIQGLPPVNIDRAIAEVRKEFERVSSAANNPGTSEEKPVPPNKPELPIVESGAKGAWITWNDTRYPVADGVAKAFDAMLDAKGLPVGIGKYASDGKAKSIAEWLEDNAPELAQIVDRGNSNTGYRLNIQFPETGRLPDVG